MKAIAVFPDQKQVSLVEHREPDLTQPTQVMLRIHEVGVCGTDREIVSFEYGTPPTGSEYLVLGHESLGEVVEVGKGVTSLKPGDLAVISVRRPCPESCPACAAGRQDFCYTGDFTERGIKEAHGFMTQYVVEDAKYVYAMPKELREIGVLTEPLTIAEKAYSQLQEIQERLPWIRPHEKGAHCTAVVLGAGPVGLLGAMKLVLEGYDTYVYSRGQTDSRKPALVKAIGAKFVASEEVKPSELQEQIGNIDVVYEALGAADISFEVIGELGRNAIFIFTGVPGKKRPIPFDTSALMRDMVLKNQIIFGTVNASGDDFRQATEDLQSFQTRWPDAVKQLITNRFAMEQFKEPVLGKGGIKNVITIGN